jgi:hypothetical protein
LAATDTAVRPDQKASGALVDPGAVRPAASYPARYSEADRGFRQSAWVDAPEATGV